MRSTPWVLSVLLHLGAGWMVSVHTWADSVGLWQDAALLREPPKPDDDKLRLGIDRSEQLTLTWLGVEQPTPHSARITSEVEQAQWTLESAPPSPLEPVQAESEPVETERSEPAAVEPEPEPTRPAVAMTEPEPVVIEPPAPEIIEAEPTDDAGIAVTVEPPAPAPTPEPAPSEEQDEPAPTEPAEPEVAKDAKPESERTARPPSEAEPGEVSDRESVAVAYERRLNVEPGRPVAGEGLRIQTRRPVLTTLQQFNLSGRTVTVTISFARDGGVKLVEFGRDKSGKVGTGSISIDQAVKASIYNYRASGAALEKLDAHQTLRVTMDISWR